jgi:hypothetical protein
VTRAKYVSAQAINGIHPANIIKTRHMFSLSLIECQLQAIVPPASRDPDAVKQGL